MARRASAIGRRQVGPLGRNEFGVHGVEALPKRVLVVGERAGQIRLAGERHQADAVSVELLDEVEDRELGPLETIGRDVLGEHAPRGVEREHDVDAALRHVLEAPAGLRPREGREERGDPEQQRAEADVAPRGGDAGAQDRQQAPVRHALEARAPPAAQAHLGEDEDDRRDRADDQVDGAGELHRLSSGQAAEKGVAESELGSEEQQGRGARAYAKSSR